MISIYLFGILRKTKSLFRNEEFDSLIQEIKLKGDKLTSDTIENTLN